MCGSAFEIGTGAVHLSCEVTTFAVMAQPGTQRPRLKPHFTDAVREEGVNNCKQYDAEQLMVYFNVHQIHMAKKINEGSVGGKKLAEAIRNAAITIDKMGAEKRRKLMAVLKMTPTRRITTKEKPVAKERVTRLCRITRLNLRRRRT